MKKFSSLINDDSGSIATLTIVLLTIFIGLLAYVVDLGHLHTVQNELRNAADACALRGARAFLPDDIPPPDPLNPSLVKVDPDHNNAVTQAHLTITDNRSDNVALADLPTEEIDYGIWYYKASESPNPNQQLQPWEWPPPESAWGKYIGPGIRVPTKRDGSHNSGPVSMTMAQIFGRSTIAVTNVKATAALSGVGSFPTGYGTFPIAVDVTKARAAGDIIFFGPDDPDVGGWTSLGPGTASASTFKGLINGSIESPPVTSGDSISLQNGVACTAIKEAIKTYNCTESSTGVYHPSPQPLVWFPGVEVDTFNQSAEVKGGLFAYITEFRDSNAPSDILIPGSNPPKYTGKCMIKLRVEYGIAGGTSGGGAWYGVLSTEPKLVQ